MYYKMYANIMDTPTPGWMAILLSPRDNILWMPSIANSAQLSSFCWVQRLVEWDWTWLEHLIWSCMILTGIQLQIFRSGNNRVHVGWDGHQMDSWLILNCLTLHVLLLPIITLCLDKYNNEGKLFLRRKEEIFLCHIIYTGISRSPLAVKIKRLNSLLFLWTSESRILFVSWCLFIWRVAVFLKRKGKWD